MKNPIDWNAIQGGAVYRCNAGRYMHVIHEEIYSELLAWAIADMKSMQDILDMIELTQGMYLRGDSNKIMLMTYRAAFILRSRPIEHVRV